jgi:hypothetical protein
MMFMMTIPPTTREIIVIGTTTAATIDRIILAPAEGRTQPLLDSDDGELQVLNFEASPQRRAAVRKEIRLQIIADHGHK